MSQITKKYTKHQWVTLIVSFLAIVAFFLPLSSGISSTSFDMGHSFNLIGVIKIMFHPGIIAEGVDAVFYLPFIVSCILLIVSFGTLVTIFIMTLFKKSVHIRRPLVVVFFVMVMLAGVSFNGTITEVAKTANNVYDVYPEFKIAVKTPTGSVNNWVRKIDNLVEDADEVFASYENKDEVVATLQAVSADAATYDYTTSDSTKKKVNAEIFETLSDLVHVEDQEVVFQDYFKNLLKNVSNIKNTFGVGLLILFAAGIILMGSTYSEVNPTGYRNVGIYVRHMYIGVVSVVLFGTLLIPVFTVNGTVQAANGFKSMLFLSGLASLGKFADFASVVQNYGLDETAAVSSGFIIAGILLITLALVGIVAFIWNCYKQQSFKVRRILGIVNAGLYLAGAVLVNIGLAKCGFSWNLYLFTFVGIMIASALLPFTALVDTEKYKAFSVINVVIFIIICAFILVPLWKVIVDSLDASAGYGMKFWPANWNLQGYITVITYPTIIRPFINSVITTVGGTLLGLILATLGAYVLVQFEMPLRNFFANMLLFTLIFQGGMIPVYLNLQNLGLLDTLWAVILPLAINVYNLVLMRNFFEGIPKSLIESAQIDGCSPMAIFLRIVLPLSKAALAAIGLMYAVGFWNDYTNFKLYITNSNLYNFQMKLRAMIFSSDLPNNVSISENTLQNAAIMVAIIPFMIIYPFCQDYFVKGVNIGAVKE